LSRKRRSRTAEGYSEPYRTLRKQGYGIVGRHSGVKLCHWLRKSLRGEGHCYKQEFYGIESHRCLQMSPAVAHCNFQCVFCWRPVDRTEGPSMGLDVDDPRSIATGSVSAQRRLVSGFGGAPWIIDPDKFEEAKEPRHAAISLAGEPTLYPHLSELIEEFGNMGMTTFLVSNGSRPEVLGNLDTEPTQLYVSLSAMDQGSHLKINRPMVGGTWKSLQESLELLGSLDCRTVLRLTMARDLNMKQARSYAHMIDRASPDFVEVKAYMYVGWSRYRMSMSNMPSFREIREFAGEISSLCGYRAVNQYGPSRVVLLGNGSCQPRIDAGQAPNREEAAAADLERRRCSQDPPHPR
jgi:tRNA wybutosine-synthesizing protein 1